MSSVTSASRPSAFAVAAALLAVFACLVPAVDSAASRWVAARRTAPSAVQGEGVENSKYSPSIIMPRVVLEVEESGNEQEGYTSEQDAEDSDEQTGMLGRLLVTVLSIPKSICKNMLNGVVSAIFGGAKPAGDDDAR